MSRQKYLRGKRRAKTPTFLSVPKNGQQGNRSLSDGRRVPLMPANETSHLVQLTQATTQPATSIPTPAAPSLKQSTKSKLRHISVRLGKVPSLAYALFYLLLIPAFASFYNYLPPKHFYHSTINYENSVRDELDFILDGLKKAMIMTINEAQQNSILEVNGRRVYSNHITIKDLKVLDSSFVFKIAIPFAREVKKEDLDRWGIFERTPRRFPSKNGKPVKMQFVPKEWQPIYLQLIVEASLEDIRYLDLTDSSEAAVPVKEARIKEISIPEGFTDPENPISEKEIKNMFFVRYIPTKEFFKPDKPLEDIMEHGVLVRSNITPHSPYPLPIS